VLGPSALPSPHRFVQEVSLCGHAASSPPQSAPGAHGHAGDRSSGAAAAPAGLSSASSVDEDEEGAPAASRDDRGEHAMADSRRRYAWTLQLREDHCWIVSNVTRTRREHDI